MNNRFNLKSYPKTYELEDACRRFPDVSPLVILKMSMVLHGVRLTPRLLEKIAVTPAYAFGDTEPFGIGFAGREEKLVLPGPILLRDGTFVYINYGEAYPDPYLADWDETRGRFILLENDLRIDDIDFVPRPHFFGKMTSRGTPMESLADVRAQKLILTAFQKCLFWKGGDQCHYCAFFTNSAKEAVDPEELYETVREALKEPGRFSELYVSGGSDYRGEPAFSEEIERYIKVFQTIGRDFDGRFPSQLMAPAYRKADLRRIYDETGVMSYSPNIEVWGREHFQRLCPGKEKWIGYDEWIRRTLDAVEVFGRGNVYTQIVGGAEMAQPNGFTSEAEALKSDLEACEFFARHDVICLSTLWRPHRHARLGLQAVPSLDFYIRLAKGYHDIRRAYGLKSFDDDYKRCGNHPDSDLERTDYLTAPRKTRTGRGTGPFITFENGATYCLPHVVSPAASGMKASKISENEAVSQSQLIAGKNKSPESKLAGEVSHEKKVSDTGMNTSSVTSILNRSKDDDVLINTWETRVYICVEQESTPFGAQLTAAAWYRRPLKLYDEVNQRCATGIVWQCHIAGETFAWCLEHFRGEERSNDEAARSTSEMKQAVFARTLSAAEGAVSARGTKAEEREATVRGTERVKKDITAVWELHLDPWQPCDSATLTAMRMTATLPETGPFDERHLDLFLR